MMYASVAATEALVGLHLELGQVILRKQPDNYVYICACKFKIFFGAQVYFCNMNLFGDGSCYIG